MTRSVLVVAAHPDDELLGCGGTLARHSTEGDRVHILILATGALSRSMSTAADIDSLQVAARDAAAIIGAQSPRFGGFPDNCMDTIALLDVTRAIEAVALDVDPDIVYTHHAGDLNIDHRIAQGAVMTAFRPTPNSRCREVYAFETPSSSEWSAPNFQTPFVPQRYVDVSSTFATKLDALSCYATELRPFPHPRSREAIRALAKLRGAHAGVAVAEAFSVLRQIV